jgi:hypothetical protein
VISSRRVSEVPVNLILMLNIQYKQLPADLLHCFNFFTVSFKMEYLKLSIEVVPAYSNVKRPIFLTSGCFPLIIIAAAVAYAVKYVERKDYIFNLFHLTMKASHAL